MKNANKDFLINFEKIDQELEVKIFATSVQSGCTLKVYAGGVLIFKKVISVSPDQIYRKVIKIKLNENDFSLSLSDATGKEIISYDATQQKENDIPEAAKPAPQPQDAESTEELFLIGQHLEQYRHATYSPVPYYQEALKREPKDARNNNALGLWYLRRGQFTQSEPYFRQAIKTITGRNPNPYDSEPYYNLGLCLQYQNRINEAYDAFFKATWSNAFQDSGYFSVAQIDLLRGDYELALEHINWSIDKNARNSRAYLIKVIALWKLNRANEAVSIAQQGLKRDQFNIGVLFALYLCYSSLGFKTQATETLNQALRLSRGTSHNLIEYAIDFSAVGLYAEAADLLLHTDAAYLDEPLVNYYLGYFYHQAGDEKAAIYLKKAALANSAYCFPNRLEDIAVLKIAMELDADDAKAPYYLGNLWYDKRQYDNAIENWLSSVKIDSSFPTVLRNLGIAFFNKLDDEQAAVSYFEKAYQLNPHDARILMELDQLYKRLNKKPEERLVLLEQKLEVTLSRDDLYLERAAIYNFTGYYNQAFELIMQHQFHPWEGGEGKVSGQYIYSLVEQAKQNIETGDFAIAIAKLEQAQFYPDNLGEGKLYGAQENDIFYWMGNAYEAMGNQQKARECWHKAANGLSEPSAALFYNDQQPDKIFYQGLALMKLGRDDEAMLIFSKLVNYGKKHLHDEVKLDYFAVSLPNLLIFKGDLARLNHIHCLYILGLGYLGLQQFHEAESCFNKVLQADAMHQGAKTHIRLSPKGKLTA